MHKWSMRTLTVSLTCLILSACAGKEIANTEAIQHQSILEANETKHTPEQAIQIAEDKYTNAIKAELEIYAPLHLSQAQESITQAQESLQSEPKDTEGTALMAAIAAQKFIDDGYTNKKVVKDNLKEALTHHAELVKLQAPTRLKTDYQAVHEQLLDLIKLVEEGKIPDAIRGQSALMAEMSQLEVNTLKHTHLSEAENLIEKTKDNDGDKYAQVSYKKATELLKAANIFITKNYRDRKQVKKTGEDVLWAAKHAYFVALESKKISQLEPNESEQYVLSIITHQNSISQITSSSDLAPQAITNANTQLLTNINDLKSQLTTSQQTLQNLRVTSGTPLLNTLRTPDDDEVVVIRTLSPITEESGAEQYIDDETIEDAPSFQADEQGFDSIEQMSAE